MSAFQIFHGGNSTFTSSLDKTKKKYACLLAHPQVRFRGFLLFWILSECFLVFVQSFLCYLIFFVWCSLGFLDQFYFLLYYVFQSRVPVYIAHLFEGTSFKDGFHYAQVGYLSFGSVSQCMTRGMRKREGLGPHYCSSTQPMTKGSSLLRITVERYDSFNREHQLSRGSEETAPNTFTCAYILLLPGYWGQPRSQGLSSSLPLPWPWIRLDQGLRFRLFLSSISCLFSLVENWIRLHHVVARLLTPNELNVELSRLFHETSIYFFLSVT